VGRVGAQPAREVQSSRTPAALEVEGDQVVSASEHLLRIDRAVGQRGAPATLHADAGDGVGLQSTCIYHRRCTTWLPGLPARNNLGGGLGCGSCSLSAAPAAPARGVEGPASPALISVRGEEAGALADPAPAAPYSAPLPARMGCPADAPRFADRVGDEVPITAG